MTPLSHPDFLALLRGALSSVRDEAAAGALADWLRENGYDQLAAVAAAIPALWPDLFASIGGVAYDCHPLIETMKRDRSTVKWADLADRFRRKDY
jgi:hypothetical protein